MTQLITLEIPVATPSLNTVMRQHWMTKWRARKRWVKLVRDALIRSGAYPLPVEPHDFALVRLERFGPRLLDYDNMVGGAKCTVDALRQLGLIKDDSPSHIHLEMVGLIHKRPSTRIRISAMERPAQAEADQKAADENQEL